MQEIAARRVVLTNAVLTDHAVRIDDTGRVAAIGPAATAPEFDTLVPGLIDLQVNGLDDVAVPQAEGADWDRLDALLLRQGVPAWCPTVVTNERAAMAAAVGRIADAAARRGPRPEGLGAHLEGPCLGERPGAHRTSLIGAVPRAWLDALPGAVAIVTAAPECPGVQTVWAWASDRGILASVGHSGASADETRNAFADGAGMVTHLFNAMTGLDHRSPGVAAAALLDDQVSVGLIADGIHVHPDLVRLAFRGKGPGRVALVTDAVASGARALGSAETAGGEDGVLRLADGTIAGSTVTLDQVIANVVAWGATDLIGAVRAASTTPADLLGRPDLGRIAVGARADLAALGPDGRCKATWCAGVRVN